MFYETRKNDKNGPILNRCRQKFLLKKKVILFSRNRVLPHFAWNNQKILGLQLLSLFDKSWKHHLAISETVNM